MPRAAERPVDLLPLGGSVTACQQMAHRLKQKAENNADKGRAAGAKMQPMNCLRALANQATLFFGQSGAKCGA
jgi:hypothetical protein